MANTYTQLNVHIVFAVSGRQSLISRSHNEELQKNITGIVTNKGHKLLAINNEPDHVHLLVSMSPSQSVSDLVRDIKVNSARMIKEKGWTRLSFSWQTGYGAFSCSKSHMEAVVRYIRNQEEHHRKHTFREEWLTMLKAYDIAYEERFLFDFITLE
jgi:REP element-mobilizing transposase RayT